MKKIFDTNSRNYLSDYKIIGNKVFLYLGTGEKVYTSYSKDIPKKLEKKVESQIKAYEAQKEELKNKSFWAEIKRMITIPVAVLLFIVTYIFVTTNVVALLAIGALLGVGSFKLFKTFDKEYIAARGDLGRLISSPEVASLLALRKKVKNISTQKTVGCKREKRKQPKSTLMTLEELKALKSQVLEEASDKEKIEETGTSIKFKPNERL